MTDASKNGCLLGWLFKGKPGQAEATEAIEEVVVSETYPPPVMVSNRFITDAEFSFFRVLQLAMKEDAYVLAQVALGQLIFVKNAKGQKAWRNRIQSKAVDYLICDAQKMKPLLVVELDDVSHESKDRQKRDQVLDEVLQAAGLPILHIKAAMHYDPRELRRQIDAAIKQSR